MRPVNLLPEEHRPRRAGGNRPGSAYAILGVLAVLLGMVTFYVLTSNQVSSRQADAAEAKQKAAEANAQIAQLGPFANFTQITQTRVTSVKGLAQARFDWERFVRELALVLPKGTWLTDVDASTTGDAAGAGAAAAAAAAPSGPSAKLQGCATGQPDVAKMMVRLRKMNRVDDGRCRGRGRCRCRRRAVGPIRKVAGLRHRPAGRGQDDGPSAQDEPGRRRAAGRVLAAG